MAKGKTAREGKHVVILEIRTYRLKSGTRADFLRIMREECLPLLANDGIRVVGSGGSLVLEDGREEAFLLRAFSSLADHQLQEERFYGSEEWLVGPREAVLSRIVDYHSVVVEVLEEAVLALQAALSQSVKSA